MLNLYIGYCQKLYTQHCHFLYIVNLLITTHNDNHVIYNEGTYNVLYSVV